MKIKSLFTGLVALLISWNGLAAQPVQEIVIKSELASPIMLENSQERNYLKISLTGFNQENHRRSPINLALVIDRSTSMSGDRIEKARQAAILAVNLLDKEDTLSIVAYDDKAEVVVPATKVRNKEMLIKKINQHIQPRGWTALFAGVSKGIGQVEKHLNRNQVNRIILLSDGQANVGPTSISEMANLARMAAKKGIAITTIGLGNGYNEDLMTTIAGYSDGNHAFVENSGDLEKAFSREFNDVMSVVAQDVIVTIRTDNSVKPVRLLGRDGEIKGNRVKVRLNQLYSNQEKYVLLEVIPAKGKDSEEKPLATITVTYDNLSTNKQEQFNEPVMVRYSKSQAVVKEAVVDEVVLESEIQQAAIANEQAIVLMDQGKEDEAKRIMQQNVSKLSSLDLSSPVAVEKARSKAEEQRQLYQDMDSKDKRVYRKELKEKNYSTQKQQK